jgi:hypothetical protein
MVARRKQTTQADQPVRFYKFVALTFLAITLILFGVIVFMSSKRAQIVITTKPEAVNITTTVGVNSVDSIRSITGIVESTTVDGVNTYTPTGHREEPAIATGIVTLHNETSIDQPLVATTRLLTSKGVLFRLENRVLVPAKGDLEVSVYADEEGMGGNIGPSQFTIPGLNQVKQELIYATSDVSMTGGMKKIGTVSQDDIDKATKLLLAELQEDARTQLNEASDDNVGVFDIVDSSVSIDVSVGEEVSEFLASGSATVVGVFFMQDDVVKLASDVLMSRAIDDAEYIESSDAPPAVVLRSYDSDVGSAMLDVTYTGRATINPESKQISKIMFYGKTKDEVRRYLLSLDHVYGVDVTLRPAWTQTVPHVSDHVDIVVKQVE